MELLTSREEWEAHLHFLGSVPTESQGVNGRGVRIESIRDG
jgi:hypothetical protein